MRADLNSERLARDKDFASLGWTVA